MNYALLILSLTLTISTCYSQEHEIIDFPDVEAEFPGGAKGMKRFIQQNVIYPDQAMQRGHEGKVYLSFIVERNGRLSQIKVQRTSGSGYLDLAAKSVIEKIPKWSPGKYHGGKVRTSP